MNQVFENFPYLCIHIKLQERFSKIIFNSELYHPNKYIEQICLHSASQICVLATEKSCI